MATCPFLNYNSEKLIAKKNNQSEKGHVTMATTAHVRAAHTQYNTRRLKSIKKGDHGVGGKGDGKADRRPS